MARKRYLNYKKQPLEMKFGKDFKGSFESLGLNPDRWKDNAQQAARPKAAIIREKGTNGEREMAYTLWLAGFDVKDVMMTDLISGRETLEEVNMIVFCGGFSNSDVLGSAKGWAGAFLQKFESQFLGLNIPQNNSVMLGSLSGDKLGIWVAHGEGRFYLPEPEDHYNVVAKYNYAEYPGNPNGSDYNVAGICSADGRHLAMMPHPERAIFPWQNAWYPAKHRNNKQE